MAGNNIWLCTSGCCHESSNTSTWGENHIHCTAWGYSSYLNLGDELMLCRVVMTSDFFVIACFTAFDALEQVSAAAQHWHPSSHRWSACKSPGLDTARQTIFLIREFCNEEALDNTCPAPKSRAGQKQALRL
jgi:hypothetical protein